MSLNTPIITYEPTVDEEKVLSRLGDIISEEYGGTWQFKDGEWSMVAGTPKVPVCECGAAKCGSNIHSDWCEKHDSK